MRLVTKIAFLTVKKLRLAGSCKKIHFNFINFTMFNLKTPTLLTSKNLTLHLTLKKSQNFSPPKTLRFAFFSQKKNSFFHLPGTNEAEFANPNEEAIDIDKLVELTIPYLSMPILSNIKNPHKFINSVNAKSNFSDFNWEMRFWSRSWSEK